MSTRIEIGPAQLPAAGGRAWLRLPGLCIALFSVDGRFHAIDDSCPHQGASLAGGKVEGGSVRCPAHGLRFDLATGCMLQSPQLRVAVYPIHIVEGRVFIDLPDQET